MDATAAPTWRSRFACKYTWNSLNALAQAASESNKSAGRTRAESAHRFFTSALILASSAAVKSYSAVVLLADFCGPFFTGFFSAIVSAHLGESAEESVVDACGRITP
jgi:hypothetical protein